MSLTMDTLNHDAIQPDLNPTSKHACVCKNKRSKLSLTCTFKDLPELSKCTASRTFRFTWNMLCIFLIIGFLPWLPYTSAVDTNDCWNNPCENNGACIDEFQAFRCECPTLYNGTTCANYIGTLGCAIFPCAHNATCLTRIPDAGNALPFSCGCLPGFTGVLCETNMDECQSESVTCFNEGVCVDGINQYTCNCSTTGYEGPQCETEVDECLTFNCGAGATCQNSPSSFNCVCPEGYDGTPCERVSSCTSRPCLNNGVCKDQGSGYKCSCLLGYTGVNCETLIDNCYNVTTCTGEHVICENGLNTYRCICQPGYIGSPGNCTDFDECTLERCQNGGTCRNLIDAFKCDCVTGFNGTNCEITYNNCASDPCLNGGSCSDGLGDFTCACSAGFTDKDCSNNIDECMAEPDPCYNGGSCVDEINGFTCDCPPGYTGYRCDTDINECDVSPCLNGAICSNLINSYSCSCLPGYTDKNCSVDIDDCLPNPCDNNGACYDGQNNFTCECAQEWMGRTCTELYDACSFAPCQNGATCSSTFGVRQHTCICASGYTDANCTTNIDDCVGVECGPFQVCVDGLNEHSCACPTGYSGVNCSVNIDECSTFPCKNNASCKDGLGTYTCDCQASTVNLTRFLTGGQTLVFQTGYTGTNCETDIDECAIIPSVCLHSGNCRNSSGSYTCFCGNEQLPGSMDRVYYTGTNCELTTNYCQVADEARLDPPACHNNGTCKGGNGKFTCECAPGFNGTRCKHNIDECEVVRRTEGHEPCDYNGTCIDGVNGFTCDCIPGITGPNCTVNIDDCKAGPCANGGRCEDGINNYTCNCQDTGFTGENCTDNINDCQNNPCINGAECLDGIKDYNCSCFSGYSGKNCDVDIQECDVIPCQHSGRCFERSRERYYPNNPIPGNFSYDTAGGYFCICPDGYNGSSCEFDIDECLLTTEPCFNGGTCQDAVNSFTCDCAAGFNGDRCEMEINECLLWQPCRNGATCHDRVADYECECLPSLNRIVYGGKNCSLELTGCSVNQCENGASCLPRLEEEAHRYSCDCLPGWSGDLCTQDTSASFPGNSFLYQQGPVSNVSVRISTTVPDGVLSIIGSVQDNFISLELVNGKVCVLKVAQLSQKNSCLPIKDMNDGGYYDLFLQLSDSEVSLSSTGDQRVAVQLSNKPDDVTFGGSMFVDLINYTTSKKSFIGCSQDMLINSNRVLVRDVLPDQMANVTSGCTRTQQCFPSTCQTRGVCLDMWFSAECQCDRPYYGVSCEHEIPPVTFSPALTAASVQFQLTEVSQTDLDLSFFFTTQTQNGVLFYMGGNVSVDNFVQLYVKSGMICVKYRVCTSGEQEECSPQGIAFNDGQQHFIQLHRKITELSFLVDGMKMFDATDLISAGVLCEISSEFVYFGYLPNVVSQRKRRQTDNPGTRFKGVIQDVRMNDNLVLFYPLSNAASNLPSAYPGPAAASGIAPGVVNDPVCSDTSPCQNNATCMDIDYNDYNCSCTEGFSGKDCDLEDFCHQSPCPGNSTCQSVRGGYECVSAATFDGGQNSVQYQAEVESTTELNSISLRFRTRQQSGVLLSVQGQPGEATYMYFKLELTNGRVQAFYDLGSGSRNITTELRQYSDGEWHSAKVQHYNSSIFLEVDNVPKILEDNSVHTLSSLVKISPDLNVGGFEGCLDEVRIGTILLPFYSDNDLQISINNNASERFKLVSQGDLTLGCKSADVCVSIPSPVCQNEGTCIDLWNKFECNCSRGWEGDRCQDNVDDCVNNVCQNGATCKDLLNDYNCSCVPGYYGYRCEAEINECQDFPPCLNDGLCTDLINGFSCNCTANYTGERCEIKITETCDREPCKNGATCKDYNETISGQDVARFNCSCAPGYEGRVCDKEIDYCELADYPCQYGSTCVSNITILDYICECVPGYKDKNCSTDIDECEAIPCKNGATCKDLINDYNCSCASGWEGVNCSKDIEECSQPVNPCGDRGSCKEQLGSFECLCEDGFTGKPCADINECDEGKCKNGASCNNTVGDYVCNCTLGYEGKDCDKGNCSYRQCLMGSTCLVHPDTNQWSCECQPYYDGDRCDIRGPCVDEPCQNGATCKQNITSMTYTCECAPGFDGDDCEEDKDECLDFPCLNNGTCNNTIGSYICFCDLGFTGHNCEVNIDDCEGVPCKNGGICNDLVNGFHCDCLDTGYEGLTCSEDIDECDISAPCQHGSCINKPGEFVCECNEGYAGDLCETAESTGDDNPALIGIIIGSVVGFLVLVAIVCLIIFIVLARNKRATRGTYSPSRQEMSGSRVELGHVIKPPPEERLI